MMKTMTMGFLHQQLLCLQAGFQRNVHLEAYPVQPSLQRRKTALGAAGRRHWHHRPDRHYVHHCEGHLQ